jgi:hypothetical protein
MSIQKVKIENGCAGFAWFTGWLFTIGFLHLTFWQGVLALIIWPFDIGTKIAALVH